MAYNAGLSRVRRWQRQYPNLPPDLLAEVVPFNETRHYVRKILVSTAAYKKLYEDGEDTDAVELFYPHLLRN
jgi:soluble lytic murein transglycosylase